MSKADYDALTAQGLTVETVGDLLGGHGDAFTPAEPVDPPRLEGQSAFPQPGIYFGMPEDAYHAIHAASTSGLKRLSTSSMDYWANSCLNPDRDDSDSPYANLGKAYHKRIVEGREAFEEAFAIELDPADYRDDDGNAKLITTVAEIKAAIAKHGWKPSTKVMDNGVERPAKKEDWIADLLALDPEALVWDAMVEAHAKANEGKAFISAKQHHRIEIAAKMIEAHPELVKAFAGGYPEVSVFWHCPETGCPMKARFDYLKMRAIVDLKSFSNSQGMPVDRAIERAIASYRYNLQHVAYIEAAQQARAMIREKGKFAIHSEMNTPGQLTPNARGVIVDWCEKWAKQPDDPAFMFVFQQTGNAPVTRGKIMPTGTVYSVTRSRFTALKRRWVECAKEFGVLPWLDIAPVDTIEDEAIPLFATEL